MQARSGNHRHDLQAIAHRVMLDRGLEPDFPPDAKAEADRLSSAATPENAAEPGIRDLRQLLWSSIDNDDSRDLDQIEVAEAQPGDAIRIWVAIADVDALVRLGSAIDRHAKTNTTSVYTAAQIFPMLPEKLSTGLTSLNDGEDRLAIVMEMTVAADGTLAGSDIYPGWVHNRCKLAYDAVAAWLEGTGPMPPALAAAPGMDAQVRLQDQAAVRLRQQRHEHGALDLETIEARPVLVDGKVVDLKADKPNRAKQLIEDFMVAANGVTARFLDQHGLPSLRRVVRTPKRWDRIVELAAGLGGHLPAAPDAPALNAFLEQRHQQDPVRFPELSLSVIKLLGPGEYVADPPGGDPPGHFGLAVRDYTHSTAPNRRYPDLITHRLLKAAFGKGPSPYSLDELARLGQHCTEQEDAAQKVERQVRKSAAALLLENRVGESFDAIVTGASDKGTWVRIFHPVVEGRLEQGSKGLDVGDKVRVRLLSTDVERGFIDFAREDHGQAKS
ncbi:MAG TPA: RNB domain-containing ribonuclease [Thermoanaerobaculia bacterium]|jgi:exoribonuclease-2|nr:RNB domain-containing ribonuclease [Thermoanaerobaculia bacterium]